MKCCLHWRFRSTSKEAICPSEQNLTDSLFFPPPHPPYCEICLLKQVFKVAPPDTHLKYLCNNTCCNLNGFSSLFQSINEQNFEAEVRKNTTIVAFLGITQVWTPFHLEAFLYRSEYEEAF